VEQVRDWPEAPPDPQRLKRFLLFMPLSTLDAGEWRGYSRTEWPMTQQIQKNYGAARDLLTRRIY